MAAAGFLPCNLSGTLPYVWRHITVNKMCWVSLHKTFPSFLSAWLWSLIVMLPRLPTSSNNMCLVLKWRDHTAKSSRSPCPWQKWAGFQVSIWSVSQKRIFVSCIICHYPGTSINYYRTQIIVTCRIYVLTLRYEYFCFINGKSF